MAALISQVLSPNVSTDLESLIKTLGTIEKHFDTINTKGIGIGNIGTIAEYTALVKKQDDTIKELTKTIDKYKQVSAAVNQAVRDDSDRTTKKRIADDEKAAKQLIAEAQRVQNARRKELEKEQADSDKTTQKVLANELKKREAADLYIRKMQEKADKLQKAAEKEAATLAKSQEAYALLSKEYNEAAKAAQNLGAQQYKLSQNVKNGVDVQFNTSEMVRLAPALALAKDKANGLHKALLDIDQTVGRSQRNVGNYASATYAMSQVLREAPAFAWSFSQGLMGIANNIPILIDKIVELKTANIELMAQGKATIPIWKQLAAAFTSPVGIITILTAAITIFAARMSMAANETKKAADSLEEYKKKLEDFSGDISSTIRFEKSKADSQLKIMQDQTLTLSQRYLAYKQLQTIAPKIFDDLDKEGFKTAENTKRMKDQIATMGRYIEIQTQIDKGRAHQNETIKEITSNEKAQEKLKADIVEQELYLTQEKNKSTPDKEAMGLIQTTILEKRRELNVLIRTGKQLTYEELQFNAQLQKLERERAGLEGNTKDKATHPEKDAKKDMEAELKLEQELFERDKIIIQKKYDQSRKTFAEEKAMQESLRQSAMVHYDNMIAIVDKYHGKVGEKEELYKARKIQAENDRLAVENATNEAERKIAEEVQKRHIEEGKRIDEQIDKLEKLRAEVEKVNREIETIQAKAASKKEYASGFSPFLQALGFDGSFAQGISQRNTEIEGKRGNIAAIQSQRADEDSKGSGADLTKLLAFDKQIADERKGIAELEAANEDALNQKIIKGKEELARRTIELAQTAYDSIRQIQDNQFAAEQKYLNDKMQAVTLQSQQEMAAIDATTQFQVQKDNQKAQLAAQTAAKQNELQQQSNNLAIRKAKADKQAAEMEVIIKTATAIMNAFAQFPYPVAIPIAVALAATGATQYAAASSAPLPQFEKGGTTKTRYFVAGEKGKELITTPSGQMMLTPDTATVMTAPIGSKVTRHDETMKLINFATQSIGMNASSLAAMQGNSKQMTDEKIVAELRELRSDVLQAAMIGRVIKNTVVVKQDSDLQRPNL